MSKNLKYFMREAAEVEKVVTVPAPESFKDENGKVIQLEVKVLSSERIRAIAYASLTCERICPSPSTSESRLDATLKRWRMHSSSTNE